MDGAVPTTDRDPAEGRQDEPHTRIGLNDLADSLVVLKRIKRTGWVLRGVPCPESLADHSFGVALLALFLTDRANVGDGPRLDTEKVLRMSLLHDLPEALCGDLAPFQKKVLTGQEADDASRAIVEAEARALDSQLAHLPPAVRKVWLDDWREYRAGETVEARMVARADALDCVLQAAAYEGSSGADLTEFRRLLDRVEDPAIEARVLARWPTREDRSR